MAWTSHNVENTDNAQATEYQFGYFFIQLKNIQRILFIVLLLAKR